MNELSLMKIHECHESPAVFFKALVYIVYMKTRYYFSLVRTSKKSLKKFELRVDVQKRALSFRGKLDNRCVSFIQFTFSSNVVIW